jgi:4-hydroxybenzoate polyprenyltransferase
MRPYLFFISGFAGMAGMALTRAEAGPEFWVALVPFFLSYGFGQALTDCFQIDTDRISAPYRPLSRGIINKKDVLMVSVLGLLSCIILLYWFNPYNLVFGILSFFGLATYSQIKRNYWPLGPPYNALIVSFLPIMGFLCFSDSTIFGLTPDVLKLSVLLFLSYSIFVLMGYLKDISADTKANYRTFSVVWGWDATVWVSDLFYGLTLLGLCFTGWIDGYGWILFSAAVVVAVASQVSAHFQKVKTEEHAAFAIGGSVRFFIICCLIVIYAFKPLLWPVLISGYILFELTLYNRPEKTQF